MITILVSLRCSMQYLSPCILGTSMSVAVVQARLADQRKSLVGGRLTGLFLLLFEQTLVVFLYRFQFVRCPVYLLLNERLILRGTARARRLQFKLALLGLPEQPLAPFLIHIKLRVDNTREHDSAVVGMRDRRHSFGVWRNECHRRAERDDGARSADQPVTGFCVAAPQ